MHAVPVVSRESGTGPLDGTHTLVFLLAFNVFNREPVAFAKVNVQVDLLLNVEHDLG